MARFKIGDQAQVQVTFTPAQVSDFARISGDLNPLHLDDEYAAKTVFKRPIVHGMLVASLFSRLLGMVLPGEGTIYLGQTLRFTAPVYVDEEVTAVVEVVNVREDKPIATFRTVCTNPQGEVVIDGEAVVRVPR